MAFRTCTARVFSPGDPSPLCWLCQPLRRMLIGSCQQAAGSPGKGDEGGGIAFCQAPRPLHSFPRAWWGLQEIASECSTSLESSCGRAPFVLRYKQPPAVLFILEVPGVADDTLIYRLVPKDSACSLALCSPTAPSNWPALQSSSCLLTALN